MDVREFSRRSIFGHVVGVAVLLGVAFLILLSSRWQLDARGREAAR